MIDSMERMEFSFFIYSVYFWRSSWVRMEVLRKIVFAAYAITLPYYP